MVDGYVVSLYTRLDIIPYGRKFCMSFFVMYFAIFIPTNYFDITKVERNRKNLDPQIFPALWYDTTMT